MDEETKRLLDLIAERDPNELFQLEEQIAKGSYGVVYKGATTDNREPVAVKIIPIDDDDSVRECCVEIEVLIVVSKIKPEHIRICSFSKESGIEINT